MKIEELSLQGVKLLSPRVFQDDRGFFLETYREDRYRDCGIGVSFMQDNHSFSKKGTLRGMHFQAHPGQDKLVSVIEGEIFDVVVDLRKDSPTFKKWVGVHLDGKSHKQLFIPIGFAHGFCVLSETAHVRYKVSSPYQTETEKSFYFADPDVGIKWPMENPIISERDAKAPSFSEAIS